MNRTVIVIPSLEPDQKLISLLETIQYFDQSFPILVIDDGSGVEYQQIFDDIEKISQCQVIHHKMNKGKGAALKTALREVLSHYPQVERMITIDADGQHSYEDMMKCILLAQKQPDALILGTRTFAKDVPLRSKIGNVLTRNILRLATGINIEDTQTGLRVIPRTFMEPLLDVAGDRFEYETNMLVEAKKINIPIETQTIDTIYIEENASSHFRIVADSLAIYSVFLKYLFFALASFAVDMIAYTILIHLLINVDLSSITIATVSARIISAVFNYLSNRIFVFNGNSKNSFFKYLTLMILIMSLSSLSVYAIHLVLPLIHTTFVKIVVDSLLFFMSYRIQKNYIFKE